jgi:hypothetical protein
LGSVELPVPANLEQVDAPTMLRLGGMMKSVVQKQVSEQVGRAKDRSVLIDRNAETAGAGSFAICLRHPHCGATAVAC